MCWEILWQVVTSLELGLRRPSDLGAGDHRRQEEEGILRIHAGEAGDPQVRTHREQQRVGGEERG